MLELENHTQWRMITQLTRKAMNSRTNINNKQMCGIDEGEASSRTKLAQRFPNIGDRRLKWSIRSRGAKLMEPRRERDHDKVGFYSVLRVRV